MEKGQGRNEVGQTRKALNQERKTWGSHGRGLSQTRGCTVVSWIGVLAMCEVGWVSPSIWTSPCEMTKLWCPILTSLVLTAHL